MVVETLTYDEMKWVEAQLEQFDEAHVNEQMPGIVQLGIKENGKVVAGVFASMSAFQVLYVSILFVVEAYRLKGYGKALMSAMEEEGRRLGAAYVRLDTFDFQGRSFYQAIGYEEIGAYEASDGAFSEHFFLKRL